MTELPLFPEYFTLRHVSYQKLQGKKKRPRWIHEWLIMAGNKCIERFDSKIIALRELRNYQNGYDGS